MDAARSDGGGGPTMEDAVAICVWTTACLNTEDSYGGAAPNTNVGSCLATYESNHASGIEPWDELRDCVASSPSSCAEFRRCLLDREAICELPVDPGELPDWIEGAACAGGSRSCTDAACLASACTGGDPTCADATTLVDCSRGGQHQRCDTECVTFMGSAMCAPGAPGTCSGGPSFACDGDVAVGCQGGLELRLDCARYGMPCAGGGCTRGTECTYMDDACEGDVLHTCFSGYRRDVDCAALGGTCGTVRGARDACVLPEGAPIDGGTSDAGTGVDAGDLDAGLDAGTIVDAAIDAPTADAGGDSGPLDAGLDGPLDAGLDGGACHTLALGGSMVYGTAVAGPVPAFTGGTIAPGVYHLVAMRVHNGAPIDPAAWLRRTIRFSGDMFGGPLAVTQEDSSGMPAQRLAGTYGTPGTTMVSFAFTCPIAVSGADSYTATPTTLSIGQASSPDVVYVYALDGTIADAGMPVDGGGACASIAPGGPMVAQTMMAGTLPAFTGGTIADGTYHLTAYEVYAPGTAGGGWLQISIVVAGGTIQRVVNGPGLPMPQLVSGTYTTAGNVITLAWSCPAVMTQMGQYTATPTTLMVSGPPGHRTIFTRM